MIVRRDTDHRVSRHRHCDGSLFFRHKKIRITSGHSLPGHPDIVPAVKDGSGLQVETRLNTSRRKQIDIDCGSSGIRIRTAIIDPYPCSVQRRQKAAFSLSDKPCILSAGRPHIDIELISIRLPDLKQNASPLSDLHLDLPLLPLSHRSRRMPSGRSFIARRDNQ